MFHTYPTNIFDTISDAITNNKRHILVKQVQKLLYLDLFLWHDVGFDVELGEEGEEDAGLHDDDVSEQVRVIAVVVEQLKREQFF